MQFQMYNVFIQYHNFNIKITMGNIQCNSRKQDNLQQLLSISSSNKKHKQKENQSDWAPESVIQQQKRIFNSEQNNQIKFMDFSADGGYTSKQLNNQSTKHQRKNKSKYQYTDNYYINNMSRRRKQTDMKLEFKKLYQNSIILQNCTFQPNLHHKVDFKLEEFLKNQEKFLNKKRKSIERSRQYLQNELSMNLTYTPQISKNTRKIIQKSKKKQNQQKFQINISSIDYSSQQKQRKIQKSPPKKTKIILSQQQSILNQSKSPKINLKKQVQNIKNISPKNKKTNAYYLGKKLLKQFYTAIQKFQLKSSDKINYIKFSQILKDLRFIEQNEVIGGNKFILQRTLLSEAWILISSPNQEVQIETITAFIFAICGLSYFSLKQILRKQNSLEMSASRMKRDYNNQTKDETIKIYHGQSGQKYNNSLQMSEFIQKQNSFTIQRLNQSYLNLRKQMLDTFGYKKTDNQQLKFNKELISYIQNHFQTFYYTKITKTHGYSQLLTPIYKNKQISDSIIKQMQIKLNMSNDNTDDYSFNHKNKIIEQAIRLKLISENNTVFNSYDLIKIEKLIRQKLTEDKKKINIKNQLSKCTFKPKTNAQKSDRVKSKYLNYQNKEIKVNLSKDKLQKSVSLNKTHPELNKYQKPDKQVNQIKLQIDINLGQTIQRINITESDDPKILASSFLTKHNLSLSLKDQLERLIIYGLKKAMQE